jgi:hypothetical protein
VIKNLLPSLRLRAYLLLLAARPLQQYKERHHKPPATKIVRGLSKHFFFFFSGFTAILVWP